MRPSQYIYACLCWAFTSPALFAACPDENFSNTPSVQDNAYVSAIDISQNESTTQLSMDINFAVTQDNLVGMLTQVQTPAEISVENQLWTYTAAVAGLTVDNLEITYSIDNNNHLLSMSDPSSKVEISVVNRFIDVSGNGSSTSFDTYIDFIFDYGDARIAGPYTGTLTITVDCTL